MVEWHIDDTVTVSDLAKELQPVIGHGLAVTARIP